MQAAQLVRFVLTVLTQHRVMCNQECWALPGGQHEGFLSVWSFCMTSVPSGLQMPYAHLIQCCNLLQNERHLLLRPPPTHSPSNLCRVIKF